VSEGTLTQIPAPRVPLIDERTGLVTREWFRFFNNIYVITGGSAEGVIPISSGGTGATSASQARANLQAGTVNRVLGEGSVNGIFLTGNVTTEGSIRLNGTLRLDTFIIGAAAVSNGGTGVQCTGITTQTADFNVSNDGSLHHQQQGWRDLRGHAACGNGLGRSGVALQEHPGPSA
jgi:hypothetical protein